MPNLLQKPYYPKLSDLITLDNIPSSLDFVKNISQSIFSKLYYKNYQASIGSLGESAFYSLSIVPKDQIGFDLVYGLKFVLNRDYEDSTISSFPITVQYNWPIIAYFSQFNLDSFSFSPQELYNIALVSLNLTEVTIINQAINVFTNTTQDPVNKFVDDVNVDLAGSLSTPIPYPTSDDRINELVISINNSYEEGVSLAIFTTYILDNFSISSTKNNLKKFFRAILPIDIDEYIREIITPYAAVTLETSASIEFPRNILKPWIQNASGELSPDLDETHKTYFDFAKAVFYADTAAGIGYSVDIAGTLSPTYSEIGNTGLLIQVDRLKLDLSRTKNIPEADFYGYSPDFMGVYARAISVTFPPKWFYDDNTSSGNSTTTLRLGAYDLLVGNGGVSGTIMLESVPIINPGGSFEYYNNDFSFDYPVTLYDLDPLTEEVMEITVDNYSELKNILATLSSASEAPYPFKFPLSLTPIGQSDSLVFDTAPAYQIYLAGLSNNVLWKRIGKEDGFAVGFRSFDITLLKNSVTASNIAGSLKIPKFKYPDDTPVVGGQPVQIDVAGHLEGNGDFLLTASTNPPFPIQFGNVFKLHLRSVELGKEGDDFFIGASADVEFLDFLGDLLEGQTISISALRIYSDGRIDFRVNGGNLTLPKPVKLKIGPTELSVTAIHFGSHEREYKGKIRKYNYFGFDGGVSIGVAGIDARGDGIKYYYTIDDEPDKPHDSYLHIQTIHIDMVIPANSGDPSVAIKGWLTIPEPGDPLQEYQGGVDLKIKKPRINGKVDMRLAPKYPAFLIDAAIELPNPIAMGPVSIYGFRGLLGYRYVAEKKAIGMNETNTWYQYYTAPTRGVNVKKFSRPDQTEDYSFPFSLGVGAIIGDTMAMGNIISANAMLLLSLPSMVMVDARMKLLSKRVSFSDDPPFFAFFIFGDNSLEFGFGADYKCPENSGDIIKLYAEIQAGFFFNNPSAWYINFGTKQQPITAKLLKDLFTLKAYLMISGNGIEAGARGEFRFDRKFGPIKVFVLAYLELGGRISFQKPQMGAYFEAGLVIDIDVVIIKVYLAVTILLAVESPKPFLIYGKFTLEFKVKILFFKIKFKAELELKWEFNKEVDRTPVNPFTEIPAQTESLVKGISMLTNETFDLLQLNPDTVSNLNPSTIHRVVPMDTYIDIKTTKGLLPSSSAINSKIGGYNNPAGGHQDLIPPEKIMKGLELRQVKHHYTIEEIEVKAHNGISWIDYNPFKAMEPSNQLLDNLKVGQWQKKDNQYNAIRLLGTTPFSYTEQGNPGWFIPEQYGIMPSTLFCQGQLIENSVSDFLEKPLNTLYYASSSNFFQSEGASYQISGDVQYTVGANGSIVMTGDFAKVSDEPNIYGFLQSLEFPNHSSLIIMLPAPSVEIAIKLSTYSTGLTVTLYNPIISNSSTVQYDIYHQEYIPKDNLDVPFVINNVPLAQGITKIVIQPDVTNITAINQVISQMDVLMNEGYQIAIQNGGGIVGNVQPNNPNLYNELQHQLQELQSIGCEGITQNKYEEACAIYPQLVNIYNNSFNLPFQYELLGSDDEKIEYYNAFIQSHFDDGSYGNVLQILTNVYIPELIYSVNCDQYAHLLEELNEYLYSDPNEVITRFEKLKAKLYQLLNLLKGLSICNDENLCNLGANLLYQDFYDQNSNSSPMVDNLMNFINSHSWYNYLNEYLNKQISTILFILENGIYYEYQDTYNTVCQEIISIISDIGNCGGEKKCFTLFHEVAWLSVEDYEYNINIPGQAAITQDTQATIDAITKSIQPIWRPDTSYYVKFILKDTVDNGQGQQTYKYAYGFRTAGTLGFFHLDNDATYGEIPVQNSNNILEDTIGIIRDPNGNVIDDNLTPHPELYPHTNLRAYIDYERSYPNADGNIVSAKPLFYDDETTKISLYFTSSYVSKLLDGWDAYNGMEKLGGTMKIIIKDPVEGIEIINPPRLDTTVQTIETSPVDIPQTIEEWAQDDNPAIPSVLNQYFNMLNSGANCTGIVTLVKPKSIYRIVTPKKLKPQKLYTAQVLNFYWGKNQIDVSQITDDIKKNYTKEVHKFVFQTSRYKDFKEQVNSFNIKYVDENGVNKTKQAIFTISKEISLEKATAAFAIIQGLSNPLSEAISLQYQHPFDRIMQGLFEISPLEDAVCTEVNRIVDKNSGKIIALLIRNPEPFNHTKIPLKDVNRQGTTAGMIEVWNGTTFNSDYKILYSKDYSQALIMNTANSITEVFMNFKFIYKTWNGLTYVNSSEEIIQNIKIN